VNDLSLLVSGHCPPSVIRSRTLKCTTGKIFPSMVAILLALYNFPKAVEAVTEATSKPLRVRDLALQDSERDLSVKFRWMLG
jgi:hypothetical protein